MSIATNIKNLRTSHGLSQSEFGKIAGVSDKAVSTWEIGEKIPRMGSVEKISVYFGIPKSRILDDSIESNDENNIYDFPNIREIRLKRFPVLGEIACGKPIFANEEREQYIMADMDIAADFCLVAKGDSMINARIKNGDVVFIRKQENVENGEIAAVIIENEATLKKLYYYPESNKLALYPENPEFEPLMYVGEELDHIHVLGKAVYFMSSL